MTKKVFISYAKEDQTKAIADYSSRFLDFNRKTLMQKILLLATRWKVSLAGIEEADILAAKSARDQIVHRGSYSPKMTSSSDLHDHLLVTRELVVRFILTALKFEGNYYSFIDGYEEKSIGRATTDMTLTS